jgi:hypothetical protein
MPKPLTAKYWPVSLTVLALASSACSAPVQTPARQAQLTLTDPKTKCTLVVPAKWAAKTVSWTGKCLKNQSSNNGVARMMTGSKVVAIFYGTAFNGAPKAGVIEFIGKDSDGKKSAFELIPTREIHTKDPDGKENGGVVQFINAYDAINAFADTLDKAGNKPSADYYRSKTNDISLYFGE